MEESEGNALTVESVKNENELFNSEEYNQQSGENHTEQQPDQLNSQSNSQQTNDDQANDEDRSTTNDDEENSDDEEEDESDDDITITISDINNVVPTTSAATGNNSFTYQPVNLNLTKRGPGGQVIQNLAQAKAKQTTGLDIEQAGQYNGQSIFDLNLDSLEDKPWRKPGADITDYFNYGFTEETWKIYCDRQKRLRNEMNPNENSTMINNDRLMSNNQSTINQNGNNIVLRTFTNNHNNGPSTSASQVNVNSTLQQIKGEPLTPLSSINENSKYGGNMQQKKAGPPPGRKQFGQIEVINSGSLSAANATGANSQQQQPPPNVMPMPQPPMNMNPNNMMNNMPHPHNLQQPPRRPDIKENFIQVIGQRGGPPQSGMPPGPFGLPPPYGMPPNNQMDFNPMMQNPMNYPPGDFMNQPQMPPRFPMNNQMEMNFDDQPPNNPLFREQDQDERRNEYNMHGNNRTNRNYSARDFSSREEDYRRTRESRISRDKDYESSSRRIRSPPRRSR